MPVVSTPDGLRFDPPVTPTEHFGDALMWHAVAEHYPGWWTAGARDRAEHDMAAALQAAGVPA